MSNHRNREDGRAASGLILVIIGAAWLLHNMDFPFLPYWLFTWPMIFMVGGLYVGIKSGFRGSTWIILLGVGGFFLADHLIPGISSEPFFWPIALIACGVIFILRPKKAHRKESWKENNANYKYNYNSNDPQSPSGFQQEGSTDSSDLIHISSVFSGVNRSVLSKNFQGGSISCVFGGAEVDLTQADINGRVILNIEQVFGGTKLMVPPHWVVLNEIEGVFHGVDDKRGYKSAPPVPNPDKVLVLRGSSVFAGTEIRSY